MTPWYRELWNFVLSREGFGTITVATFFGIAVGVVPNIVQELSGALWVFLVVLVLSVAAVIGGWALRRHRGVGVVACLYADPDRSRYDRLKIASQKSHSSTLQLHPDMLAPGGTPLEPTARVDLAARLISARIAEHHESDPDSSVALYPLAAHNDGFLLGRRLRDTDYDSLHIMHRYANGSEGAVPVIALGPHLYDPLTDAQRAVTARHMATTPAAADRVPVPVANPDCPAEYRHRLAVIVRITPSPSMIEDARFVATTGRTRRSDDHRDTGYRPPDEHPCGAHVVVETAPGMLPETREVFEALVVHIHQTWQTARTKWAEEADLVGVVTRLFIIAPLPIVLALGWLTARDDITFVPHERSA